MPDIPDCKGIGCDIKTVCRCYSDPPRIMRRWITPIVKDGKCAEYWPAIVTNYRREFESLLKKVER